VISHRHEERIVERFETVDIHIGNVNTVIGLCRRLIPVKITTLKKDTRPRLQAAPVTTPCS